MTLRTEVLMPALLVGGMVIRASATSLELLKGCMMSDLRR